MNPASSTDGRSVFTKVQRRIMPLLVLSWFVAYIDRFNVSFAALQMNEDLGLSAAVFGFGAGVFFLGYAVFEVPSNLLLARIGPRVWLARIMVTWGVLSAAMVFTEGALSFYVLRFLLGVAEAGCFPGMAYYLTRWLDTRQRAAALASLATMAMVSGVLGAPAAAGLLALDGIGGLAGWQWLFLVEGLPAVALGICVFRFLPDGPEDAPWLTADEREWIRAHTAGDGAPAHGRGAVRTVLADARYWIWGLSFFCVTAAGSALRLFQPTIIRQVTGLGDVLSALLTAIPSLAGVAAILYVGRRSMRLDERRWHAAVPMFLGGLGLALVGVTYGVAGALIVGSIATLGVASQPPLFASVSAAATGAVNAAGIAFVNSVAALGAFVGPYVVGAAFDRTANLGVVCAVAGAVMALGGIIVLVRVEGAPLPVPVARAATLGVLCALGVGLMGQDTSAQTVSVQTHRQSAGATRIMLEPDGRLSAINLTVPELIRRAYGIERYHDSQLKGGPDWLQYTRFDIVGEAGRVGPAAAGDRLPPAAQTLLRTLLEERFGLVVHTEQVVAQSYALVAARAGTRPGLRPAARGCLGPYALDAPGAIKCAKVAKAGTLKAGGASMADLAAILSGFPAVDRPVRDESGVEGRFDVDLTFTPAFIVSPEQGGLVPNPRKASGPGLFAALKSQLGLALERREGIVDVLVIDHVVRPVE